MNLIFAIVLGSFATVIGLGVYNKFITPKEMSQQEVNMQMAEEINKQLPKKIDKDTTWISATPDGLNLYYRYEFSKNKDDYSIDYFKAAMKLKLMKGLCNEDFLNNVLKKGTIFHYQYFDKNEEEIATILITEKTCLTKISD